MNMHMRMHRVRLAVDFLQNEVARGCCVGAVTLLERGGLLAEESQNSKEQSSGEGKYGISSPVQTLEGSMLPLAMCPPTCNIHTAPHGLLAAHLGW